MMLKESALSRLPDHFEYSLRFYSRQITDAANRILIIPSGLMTMKHLDYLDACRSDLLCVSESLCYRHRFLLRKLLVNKLWSQVAWRFKTWRAFCCRSSELLDQLLAVDQHQRQRRALLRWRRIVRFQQLGEQVEAVVIVRRSHQAAQKLMHAVTKYENMVLVTVWVEWRSWHRRRRCMLFQRGARFQKWRTFQRWIAFARQSKAQHRDCEQFVRDILHDVVNASVTKADDRRSAPIPVLKERGNATSQFADAIRNSFYSLDRFRQQQNLAKLWDHWKMCAQSSKRKPSPVPSERRLQNRLEQFQRLQRISRRLKGLNPVRVVTRKLPRPPWR